MQRRTDGARSGGVSGRVPAVIVDVEGARARATLGLLAGLTYVTV